MLTQRKIEIYKYYGGDNDRWAMSGRKKYKVDMVDDDWYLIYGFISDLTVVKNGLAAEAYAKSINDRLLENCDNEETIDQLKKLVGQTPETLRNSVKPKSLLEKLFSMFKKKNQH